MQFDIRYYDSLASTMDVARECIDDGRGHGVVIQSGEQKGGRGRRGNAWVSPFGNLYQSIILKPVRPMSEWGQLSFVIAVALSRACFEVGIDKQILNLKWPNDVLIDGRKIAGILIESYDGHVIIGTGVNIMNAPDDRAKINDYSGIGRDDFRDVFLKYIDYFVQLWEEEGFPPIRNEWMKYAYRLNDEIQARLLHETFTGVFEGLDDEGVLLLRENDGYLRKINAGEIIVCSLP